MNRSETHDARWSTLRVPLPSLAGFVRKNPAPSLLVLALFFGVAPLAPVAAGIVPPWFAQLGALSASAAGILLAAVEGRRGAVRELLGRALIWRIGIGWWAVALVSLGPLIVAALYLRALLVGSAVDWSGLRPLTSVPQLLVILVIFAGIGEEFGWRGYALPRLQARYTALGSTLIISICWALWHLPKFFVAGEAQFKWMQEAGFLSSFLGYAVFIFGWSVIYTWVFNNTRGSVLLAAVVHGAGNTWATYLNNYRGDIGNLWALAGLMLVVAAVIIRVAGPEHLSRRHERSVLEPGAA
jgi:membrane protease YdiL (CAAX protease family)